MLTFILTVGGAIAGGIVGWFYPLGGPEYAHSFVLIYGTLGGFFCYKISRLKPPTLQAPKKR
jgi:hypothetical protein